MVLHLRLERPVTESRISVYVSLELQTDRNDFEGCMTEIHDRVDAFVSSQFDESWSEVSYVEVDEREVQQSE